MKRQLAVLACTGILAVCPALSVSSLAAAPSFDLNGDGALNGADMRAFLLAEAAGDSAADLNQNGTVNAADEALLWSKILACYRAKMPTVTATETATQTATETATATATDAETTTTAAPTTTTEKTTKPTTAPPTTAKPTAKKTTAKPVVDVSGGSAQSFPKKQAVLVAPYTPTLKTSSAKESTFMKKIKVVNSATGKIYKGDTKANLQLAITADVKYELGSSRYAANSTEAWKAHAVVSYTRICDVCASGSTFTISMGEDVNLKNKNDKRIYDAVGEVLGVKLMTGSGYKNTCNVFYSASAAGTTSSCGKVYTEDLPYARSVYSPETDALVEAYGGTWTSSYTASFDSILADVADYMEEKIYVDKKAGAYPLYATEWDGAYVSRTNLYYLSGGEKVYLKGRHVQAALGLRSASFVVSSVSGNKLTLTVRGHGHGLGLSQLGAVIYANEYGWTYSQILAHYFSITAGSAHQLCKPNW